MRTPGPVPAVNPVWDQPQRQLIGVRLTGEGSAQTLAEHFEDEGFALPMTIVVVDRDNEAARITVTASGRAWH